LTPTCILVACTSLRPPYIPPGTANDLEPIDHWQ